MKNITVLQKNINKNDKSSMKFNIIYCVSWAPGNDPRIAAVNSNGELLVWDTEKSKLVAEITPAGHFPIYRVDWNKHNSSLLASGSSENCW